MARLAPASRDKYVPLYGEDAPLSAQIYAHRPPLATALRTFIQTTRDERVLPDRLVELVRLRVAFWNQCRSCMAIRYSDAVADGVTEELVCSLEKPEEADDLTQAERAALDFADLFATNHLAIDDATFDRLRENFSEPEIIELLINVATFVGFGRMAASLDMVDDLPDRFRQDGRITPWGEGEIIHARGAYRPATT